MKRYIPHGLLAMVGGLMVLLSLTADPTTIMGRADVKEIMRIFGSVMFGLGVSGSISSMAAMRSEKRIETLISTFEGIVATQLREDLIPRLGISEHCQPVDDRLRGGVVLYHRTMRTQDDMTTPVWLSRNLTFSGPSDAHCLFAVSTLKSPDGKGEQTYSYELTKRRNRLLLTSLNITDPSEHAGIHIFDMMSLRDHTCGVVFHMDWAGGQRYSRSFLTLDKTPLAPDELDKLWESDFSGKYELSVAATASAPPQQSD